MNGRQQSAQAILRMILGVALVLLWLPLLAACSSGSNDSQESVDGSWYGEVNPTYYCESSPESIEFEINGTTITVAGSSPIAGATGTIQSQGDNAYHVTLTTGADMDGQLFVDASGQYAVLALHILDDPSREQGYVGVAQKGAAATATYAETDLVGSWAGLAARVDAGFDITATSSSTATITNPDGLALSGNDGDGAFSASPSAMVLAYPAEGIYVSGWAGANQVDWPITSYDAIYALSTDKGVLAAAFLTSVCDQQVFSDLPAQKFVLWSRQ